jgi:hypothetical protein
LGSIAEELGCSKATVGERSKRERWERRSAAPDGAPAPLTEATAATPRPSADREASVGHDTEEIVLTMLRDLDRNLKAGKIALMSIGDVEKAVSLLAKVQEQNDRRREKSASSGAPSIEWLTKQNATRREKAHALQAQLDAAGVTMDEVSGVVSDTPDFAGKGDNVAELREENRRLRGRLDALEAGRGAAAARSAQEVEVFRDAEDDSGKVEPKPATPRSVACPLPRHALTLSPHDVQRVARVSGERPDVVEAAYRRNVIRSASRGRIERAAQRLGLPAPHAAEPYSATS